MEEKQLELEPKVFTETRPSLQETIGGLSEMRSTLQDLAITEPATSEMFLSDPLRKSLYWSLRRYYSNKEKNQMIDERMIEKIRQDLDEFINQDPYHINILNFLPPELICDLYSDPKQKEKFTGYFNQLINTASKKNFALFIKSIPSLIDKGILTNNNFPNDFFQTPDPYVRRKVTEITPILVEKGIIPPSQYISFLQDPDPYVCGKVLETIPALIEKGIITNKNFPNDILDNILKDPDPDIRGNVAKTAPSLIKEGIMSLAQYYSFLQDPDPDVRKKFATTIPLLVKEGVIIPSQYFFFLQDPDPYVRGAAVEAIPELIEKGIITTKEDFPGDVLDNILKDTSPHVRGNVAEITPLLIQNRIIPLSLYLSFSKDPDPYVRKKFATTIPLVVKEDVIIFSQYLSFLKNSNPYVRGAAVEAIPGLFEKGIITTKEDFPGDVLDNILKDPSPHVRGIVAKTAPLLINERIMSLDQYLSFLQELDPDVRVEAVKAIPELIVEGTITKENFPFYILQDPDPYVREEIVKALPILIESGIIQYTFNNPDLYLPQGIAQNFTPLVLAQAIKETNQKINLVLKENKLDDKVLPGLLILGSAIKGYWLPNSDIDWGLIVDSTIDKDVLETAIEKLTSSLDTQGISLCHCHVIYVDNLKNGDISEMDLNEEENDAIFNLFIGQWVGNTDIRNLRNSLIRKFLNKHPEEKTKILDHMVDNLVTGNLINKGIKRRFGKEEVNDTYKKIASLLFVSKIGLPGDS